MTTTEQFCVRQAQTGDLDTVMSLLKRRIDWLRARGSDQWSMWQTWHSKIESTLADGNVWLLMNGDDAIGTLTVEFRGDRDFWTQDECAEPAVYLTKLAIRLDHAGHELGALLTDWASDYGYRRGCSTVRLDAWKTNEKLHAYYADRGWKYLRTVDNPGRNSGSLFQLPVRPLSRAQRFRLREDLPFAVLDGTQGGPEIMDADPAGNWHANHVHRGGLLVKYDALQNPCDAMLVDFMRYRLRYDQREWQLESVHTHFTNWRHQAVVLEANIQLSAEMTYVVTHQELFDSCRMVVAPVPAELATPCVQRPQKISRVSH